MQCIQATADAHRIDADVRATLHSITDARPADELTTKSVPRMPVNFADRDETAQKAPGILPAGGARRLARRCAEVY